MKKELNSYTAPETREIIAVPIAVVCGSYNNTVQIGEEEDDILWG